MTTPRCGFCVADADSEPRPQLAAAAARACRWCCRRCCRGGLAAYWSGMALSAWVAGRDGEAAPLLLATRRAMQTEPERIRTSYMANLANYVTCRMLGNVALVQKDADAGVFQAALLHLHFTARQHTAIVV